MESLSLAVPKRNLGRLDLLEENRRIALVVVFQLVVFVEMEV